MYTGPYVRPGVTHVDDIWEDILVGGFVALALVGYKKSPVIGKVVKKIRRWNKKYHGPYDGTIWTDELSKECVYLATFEYSTQSSAQRPNAKCAILYQGRGIRSYYNCFLLNNYCAISTDQFEYLGSFKLIAKIGLNTRPQSQDRNFKILDNWMVSIYCVSYCY